MTTPIEYLISKHIKVWNSKVYAIPYAGELYEKQARELIQAERTRICKLLKTIGATGTEEEVDKVIRLINNTKYENT